MQPISDDVRLLYRYAIDADPEDTPEGYASPTFTREEEPIRLYFHPLTMSREVTPLGFGQNSCYTVIAPDYTRFKLNDRIGTADEPLFIVESVRTSKIFNSQTMQVKDV